MLLGLTSNTLAPQAGHVQYYQHVGRFPPGHGSGFAAPDPRTGGAHTCSDQAQRDPAM